MVVNVPGGEIIPSLRLVLSMQASGSARGGHGVGTAQSRTVLLLSRFSRTWDGAVLVVNKKLWDSLGSTERSYIETAAAAENSNMLAEYNANNATALVSSLTTLR